MSISTFDTGGKERYAVNGEIQNLSVKSDCRQINDKRSISIIMCSNTKGGMSIFSTEWQKHCVD